MKYRTALLILFALVTPAFGQAWDKYVAPDGSFSFVYPKGWKVNQTESFIEITNGAKDEQLLVVAIPFDAAKTPRQLADGMITIFRSAMPDMTASEWKTTPAAALFRARYTNEGKKYDAHVIVVKDADSAQALWFSFSGLLVGYDQARAVDVLQKVVGSVSTGAAAVSPDRAPSNQSAPSGSQDGALEKNAKAFLFVLEFALGAPLTAGQERVILEELESGWRTSPAEDLRKYDQYPVIVQAIMKAGQTDLENLRAELEKSVREWIEDFRGKSESVRIVETEVKRRGRVLADGQPPLTEMAASAYSEIMAFSELLQRNNSARVGQIPDPTVLEIRQQLKNQWSTLSQADRESIATSPGLWLCLRTLMDHGSKSEQEKTRTLIRGLSGATEGPGTGGGERLEGSATSRKLAEQMAKHNVLMNIQQQTFNSYMWSRGFNYHPTYGKMW